MLSRLRLPALVVGAALMASSLRIAGQDLAPELDLSGWRMTFDEEFEALDVSAWGPGTRWIAHTPWHGDFGDAAFADPVPGFPFVARDGVLRIEARKDEKGWRSGLLASADSNGNGFSQQYGYFEMRAKLPEGPGLWPAFWLGNVPDPSAPASVEVDVLEHYGHAPGSFQMVVTTWFADGKNQGNSHVHDVEPGQLYGGFHTYGVMVEPDWTSFFFDRREVWRTRTPPELRRPLLILLDLALGSGWPTQDTPSPSYMYVDYVRAYAR